MGSLDDLLLVNHDPIGVFQDVLEQRMGIFDLFLAMFARDKIRNELHGAGPVQGIHGNEVFDVAGLELDQPLAHSFRLELEGGNGITTLVERKCFLIVQADLINVDSLAMVFFNKRQGIFDNAQSFEAQKVHLEHAHTFYDRPIVLSDQ